MRFIIKPPGKGKFIFLVFSLCPILNFNGESFCQRGFTVKLEKLIPSKKTGGRKDRFN